MASTSCLGASQHNSFCCVAAVLSVSCGGVGEIGAAAVRFIFTYISLLGQDPSNPMCSLQARGRSFIPKRRVIRAQSCTWGCLQSLLKKLEATSLAEMIPPSSGIKTPSSPVTEPSLKRSIQKVQTVMLPYPLLSPPAAKLQMHPGSNSRNPGQ